MTPNQPEGTVWVSTAYHQGEKVGLVTLTIPGHSPYHMRADQARKVGGDIIEAAATARFDAGVFVVAEEDGLYAPEEVEEYLRRVGRAGGGTDADGPEGSS